MPEDSAISRTIVGILHAVRCDVPIDITLLKNMHNATGNSLLQRSMKPRPPVNNADNVLCSHMWQVNEVLNKMKVKLIPIWDFEKPENLRKDKEGNDEEVRDLVGFSVVNDVVDRGFVEHQIENLIKNDQKQGKQNSKEHHEVFEEIQNEIDRMKLSGLIVPDDTERSMNHFLKQIILGFIVTRAIELKDQGNFWKDDDPLQAWTTLRDIYLFLHETFGLKVPDESNKDGDHDPRFHNPTEGGRGSKGYLKKFITQNLVKHKYLEINKGAEIRDDHINENGNEEDGRCQVMWGIRAINEYSIMDILDGFTYMIMEDGNPAWKKNEVFDSCVRSFLEKQNEIKGVIERDDVTTVLDNWGDRELFRVPMITDPNRRKEKKKKKKSKKSKKNDTVIESEEEDTEIEDIEE